MGEETGGGKGRIARQIAIGEKDSARPSGPQRRVQLSPLVLIEMARGKMAATHFFPFGLVGLAVRHRLRTARMEAAAGGRIEGIRHLSGKDDPPPFQRGMEGKCGGQ